jgi:hypothetical protein
MAGVGDHGDMRTFLFVAAVGLSAVIVGATPGTARADELRPGLVVPVLGERGVAVYCTRNLTPAAATPIEGGGYRIAGLAPGRYLVRLELPHERIDVLAVVPDEGDVIVPPVVARGRCRSIEVVARATQAIAADGDEPTWALRYGRSYSARSAPRSAGLGVQRGAGRSTSLNWEASGAAAARVRRDR